MYAKQNEQHFNHAFEPPDDQNLPSERLNFSLISLFLSFNTEGVLLVQNKSVRKIYVEKKLYNEYPFFKIAVKRAKKIVLKMRF